MRILHLAYEDPRQPGRGGGSVRTEEIHRRLAGRHEIIELVAGYPGAARRRESGLRWRPVGARTGTRFDRLTYFPAVLWRLRRYQPDLVVEEFSAPFGPGFAPLVTRAPVLASVQWLFAAQMRQKYHLPFHRVEQFGLRFYRSFVAVSGWLRSELERRQPGARVYTVYNGVEDLAFTTLPRPPAHLLYLGRLDVAQKGCDLLAPIMARVRARLGERTPPLLVAGDGPDRAGVEQQFRAAGLMEHVRFLGAVQGAEKFGLIAGAHAVLMPSRFETFGIVAAESQAAGAPLVTFDVGPLREVAEAGGAALVRPFDEDAFAESVAGLCTDRERREAIVRQGRAWARRYNWDAIAAEQERCYLDVVARHKQAGG